MLELGIPLFFDALIGDFENTLWPLTTPRQPEHLTLAIYQQQNLVSQDIKIYKILQQKRSSIGLRINSDTTLQFVDFYSPVFFSYQRN
jgi:hypothetical protein